jgi:hypothetical protein
VAWAKLGPFASACGCSKIILNISGYPQYFHIRPDLILEFTTRTSHTGSKDRQAETKSPYPVQWQLLDQMCHPQRFGVR